MLSNHHIKNSIYLHIFLNLFLKNWAIHGLFFFIFVFSIQLKAHIIFRQWLDLNRGSLELEATALPTAPQLLSYLSQFTSGNFANFEHSFAISSWMIDSILALPNPKSFKFLSKNLRCSLQYCPDVPMTPGACSLFSFLRVCQPGLHSLLGANDGL